METIQVQGIVALIDKHLNDGDEFLYIPSDEIDTIFQNNNIPVFLEHCVAYKVGETQRFYVKQTPINKVMKDVIMCDFVIDNVHFIDVLRESMLRVHNIMNTGNDCDKMMSSDRFIQSKDVKKYINKDIFTTNKGINITAEKTLLSTFPALSLGHSVPDKKAIELSLVLAGKRPNTIITSVKYHPSKHPENNLHNKDEIKTQKSDFWKVLGSLLSKKNYNRITKVHQDQIAIDLPNNEEFSMKDIDFEVNPTDVSSLRKQIIQHGNTELLKSNITIKNFLKSSFIPIDMEVVQMNPMAQGQQQNTSSPNLPQQSPHPLPGGITITYPPSQQQQYPGYYINPYFIPQMQTMTSNDDDENKKIYARKYKNRKRKHSYSDNDDDDDNNSDISHWKRLNSTLKGLSKVLENQQHQESTTKIAHPIQQTGPLPDMHRLQQTAHSPFIVYDGVPYIMPKSLPENKVIDNKNQSHNQVEKPNIPQVIINIGDELMQALKKQTPTIVKETEDIEPKTISTSGVPVPTTLMETDEKEEVKKTQTFSLPNSLEEAFAQKVNSDSYCFITEHK
jgi:hypothetical protein